VDNLPSRGPISTMVSLPFLLNRRIEPTMHILSSDVEGNVVM
jgi:hypothetical protein